MPRVGKENQKKVEDAKDKRYEKLDSAWEQLKEAVMSDKKKKKKKPGEVHLNKSKVEKFKSGY